MTYEQLLAMAYEDRIVAVIPGDEDHYRVYWSEPVAEDAGVRFQNEDEDMAGMIRTGWTLAWLKATRRALGHEAA